MFINVSSRDIFTHTIWSASIKFSKIKKDFNLVVTFSHCNEMAVDNCCV